MKRLWILMLISLCFWACGAEHQGTGLSSPQPLLLSYNPNNPSPGSTLDLMGTGFSPNPNENLLSIDSRLFFSTRYSLLESPEELRESISFDLPADLEAGTYSIFVLVQDQPSNTLELTIP